MKERLTTQMLFDTGKENSAIDIVKLILSYFVVAIHTSLHLNSGTTEVYFTQGLFRLAVPFFFVTAGYYLFSRINIEERIIGQDKKTVFKYIKRIFVIFVLWSAFYLIFQVYDWMQSGSVLRKLLIYLEYAVVRGDTYLHLWYLSSLFTGVFLVYVFNKFLSIKDIFLLSLFLFIIGLILNPYYFLIDEIVENNSFLSTMMLLYNRYVATARNGLFFGFFFVSFGALISRSKRIPKLYVSIIGLVISLILSFLEVTLFCNTKPIGQVYGALQISHIPATFFLFTLLMQIKVKTSKIGRELRKMSSIIYCVHPLFIIIIQLFAVYQPIKDLINTPFVFSLVVFVLSSGFSILFLKLEKQKGFWFIKKLH